jgi:hypothetical protein
MPQPCEDYPIIQYADDTLLIMQADARQLFFLKSLLITFAEATNLHVNYKKSQMLPINISEEKLHNLAQTFGCVVGSSWFPTIHIPWLTHGHNQTKNGGSNSYDG